MAGLIGAFFLGLFLGIGGTVLATRGGSPPAEAPPTEQPEAGRKGEAGEVGGSARKPPRKRSPRSTPRRVPKKKAPGPSGESFEARVVRVVDGDTIHVEADGKRLKIRYLGIDTPESMPSPGRSVQYYGKEASRRNAALVSGKTVRLEFDGPRTDRFGRLLCYVWVGSTLVNRTLLAEGYARVYRKAPNIRYWDEFNALEKEARRRKLGMWKR